MNNAVPKVPVSVKNIPIDANDMRDLCAVGDSPLRIDELAHELRQPLSTIESLAYYLEITAEDEAICGHLQQIRYMVGRASRILEHAVAV